jgi:hypothetical protein
MNLNMAESSISMDQFINFKPGEDKMNRRRGSVKRIILIISVLLFFIWNPSYSQKPNRLIVIKAKNNVGAISIGGGASLRLGQQFILKRDGDSGAMEVGEVKVIAIRKNVAGIKLIENRKSVFIKKGDYFDVQDDYTQGKIDGENEGKKQKFSIGWYAAGCIGSGLGVLIAYAVEPSYPGADKLMGKSQNYVAGYNQGYKSTVRKGHVYTAASGCLSSAVIAIGVNALSGSLSQANQLNP